MFYLILLASISLLLLSNAISFVRNYRVARSLNVPIIISPVGIYSPLWMVFQGFILPVLKYLPSRLTDWSRYTKRDWSYLEKYQVHAKYGDVFAHVSPTCLQLHVADPILAETLLARKTQLDKPLDLVSRMDIYGPSLATVVGEKWQHHRKITSPPFSESNCRIVWNETFRQTAQMLEYWGEHLREGANTLADDAMTLTLHVITAAGFGLNYDFDSDKVGTHAEIARGRPSYRDCFVDILGNPAMLAGLPLWLQPNSWLPKRVNSFLIHREELRKYMTEMVQTGKIQAERILQRKGEEKANILSTLVLKSEQARLGLFDDVEVDGGGDENIDKAKLAQKALAAPTKRGLSDAEILGNLFMFGLAGHETTAHTITYAIYLIIAHPAWQDWLREEINAVLGEPKSLESIDYESTFHKLLRCRALMYESLRLYPPVNSLTRWTLDTPKTFPTSTGTLSLPPYTEIFPHVNGLHTHPCWNTPDSPGPSKFHPARFITTTTSSDPISVSPLKETFSSPPKGVPKGAFNAWADGPRVCPGKKFAQVELVAVVVGLLWGHKLDVVPGDNETVEDARARVESVVKDSKTGITLGIRRPESVRITRSKL